MVAEFPEHVGGGLDALVVPGVAGQASAPGTEYRVSSAELVDALRRAGLTVGYSDGGPAGNAALSLPPVLFSEEAFVSAGAEAIAQFIGQDLGIAQLAADALQVELAYERPDGERNVFASSGPVADLLERLAVFAAEAAGN